MVKKRLTILPLSLLFFSATAYADAGLPMIVVIMPSMLLLLIPIVIIEAIIMSRYLRLALGIAIKSSIVGNVISTIVGIPITWGGLACLQMLTGGDGFYKPYTWWGNIASVTWQAPWLLPYEDDFYWMVPVAMAFLLIPFFFISWWIEGALVKLTIPQGFRGKAYQASFYGNLASYAFLELCFPLLWAIHLRI